MRNIFFQIKILLIIISKYRSNPSFKGLYYNRCVRFIDVAIVLFVYSGFCYFLLKTNEDEPTRIEEDDDPLLEVSVICTICCDFFSCFYKVVLLQILKCIIILF